jgi:acyl-CoA thioesterase
MCELPEHPFDADTRIERVGEGVYAADLSDRWTALTRTPNGGYLLALCLRALGDAMPFPDPVVASATFLRPPAIGPAEIRTELARTGRRTTAGEARLLQGGREAVRVVATYTDLRAAEGRTHVLASPPALPPPEGLSSLLEGGAMPGISITEQVEYRAPRPPGWTEGRPSGDPTLEFWMRFKGGRDADLTALALLVDAAAPAVLELGEQASATMQLTVHLRGHPAPGWLACRASTRFVIDGYHEEDFDIWDSEGRLVAQSRQLALLTG